MKKPIIYSEKQTARGILKYRMPNAIEVYDVMEACNFLSGKANLIQSKKNILAMLDRFLDVSGIEGVESYDELIEDFETFTIPLSEIADEFLTKIAGIFQKKN